MSIHLCSAELSLSNEWVKIQAKNMGGCEEERGECARISANMKVVSGCEYQPM